METNAINNTNTEQIVTLDEGAKLSVTVGPEIPAKPTVEFEDGADDELLYGEDEAGNSLKGMPLAARASVTTPIEFKTMGEKHKAELIFANVTYAARRAPDDEAENVSVKHGVIDPEADPSATLEAQRALDVDRGYQGARVALALSAVKRDSKGRLRVSVPFIATATAAQLTDIMCKPTVEQEMQANYVRAFLNGVIRSVNDFFNPASPTSTT